MTQVDTEMRKTVPVLARVSPKLKEKLKATAKDSERSESYLVAQAIAEYVELNAWQVKEIKHRLDEAKAGAPGCPMSASSSGSIRGGQTTSSLLRRWKPS